MPTINSAQLIKIKQLTPVLIVERVEPCIEFWEQRFGFTVGNKVPGPNGTLIFASVEKDNVRIMYQTRASVIAERPEDEPDLRGHSTALFFVVENLDAIETAVAGAPLVKPRHKTFYGSTELYLREPAGYLVGFAQF